jgi:hypothetical protein
VYHATLGSRVEKKKAIELDTWVDEITFPLLLDCPPRQKSTVERLKAKVEPLLAYVTAETPVRLWTAPSISFENYFDSKLGGPMENTTRMFFVY